MRVVYKFPLVDRQLISIPAGFVPRLVADQLGTPCVWVEVNKASPEAVYEVYKAGTGWEINKHAIYLGSLLESHGQFVWHYYAVPITVPDA